MTRGPLSLLLAVALLEGCATDSQGAYPEGMVQCPAPRPQVCTMEYRPVCGVLADSERKQYSSGCSACADSAVIGYVTGPCD